MSEAGVIKCTHTHTHTHTRTHTHTQTRVKEWQIMFQVNLSAQFAVPRLQIVSQWQIVVSEWVTNRLCRTTNLTRIVTPVTWCRSEKTCRNMVPAWTSWRTFCLKHWHTKRVTVEGSVIPFSSGKDSGLLLPVRTVGCFSWGRCVASFGKDVVSLIIVNTIHCRHDLLTCRQNRGWNKTYS